MAIDLEKNRQNEGQYPRTFIDFAPHYGMVKRTENKFRKKEIQNNYELTFTPDLEPQLETYQFSMPYQGRHLRSKT